SSQPVDPNELAEAVAARLAVHLRQDDKRLLDAKSLAERLGISRRGLSGLTARGELPPGYLVGGVRRWEWGEVLRFLSARSDRRPRAGRGRRKKTSLPGKEQP